MRDVENKVIELAVKIADLLAECPSVHDAQAACGIAQEIAELRVRKIAFGRKDHEAVSEALPKSMVHPSQLRAVLLDQLDQMSEDDNSHFLTEFTRKLHDSLRMRRPQ